MGAEPHPDPKAASILGAALRRIGYSEAAVCDLLGDDAYSLTRDLAPVGERRLPRTRLATVVRALFLQLPVSRHEAVRALGRRGLEALVVTGLAEVADDVVSHVRVLPVGTLFVASDDYPGSSDDDEEEPADYVAAYTPTSRLCSALTPRRRVARALDVGAGSGVQALMAARHAGQVVATDVNPRALAYTKLNAALNGLTNIECRQGSLFEPVDGERFDLVTCNAPYVVSPEHRLAYRDGGRRADELSEHIVRAAADHLDEGGFASLIVSWIAADEEEPEERPLSWTDALHCDAWILPIWTSDPLGHAAIWNDHLSGDPERFRRALDDWTRYLARVGAGCVSEGGILLHRGRAPRYTTRVDEVDDDVLEEAGDQIQRGFESRARLSDLRRADELLEARLSAAMPLTLEHELEPRRGRTAVVTAHAQLAEGTHSTVEGTKRALELVASLDGRTPLAELVQAAADRLRLSAAQAARLRREALDVIRELLELGALRFADREKSPSRHS
jgi:methylase of polypeptide subunit release factors